MPIFPQNLLLAKVQGLSTTNNEYSMTFWFFRISGSTAAMNMTVAGSNFLTTWMTAVFTHTFASLGTITRVWLFHHALTMTHSSVTGNLTIGPVAGFTIAPTMCPCFTRGISKPGKNQRVYLFMPPIPQSYITDRQINSTGMAVYQSSATAMMNPFFTQGRVFVPVIWSAKDVTIYGVNDVKILRIPRTIRKRRETFPYIRTPMIWPIVP